MTTNSIRRIIASAALIGALPLGIIGLRSLVGASRGYSVAPVAGPAVPAGPRFTIKLAATTGEVIQRSIYELPAEGGRIVLSAGTYVISAPIFVDRDDVEISGDAEETVLQLSSGSNCPLLVIGSRETPPPDRVRRVVLRQLTLDGNRHAQDHECHGGPCDNGGLSFIRNNALTIRAAEDVRIERVTTLRARSGGLVLEKNCRRIHVSDFTSHDNHFDGLAAYETEESHFTRIHLHCNTAAGLSVDIRFNRNIVSDARLENNGSQGLFMRDSNFNNFSRLTIDHNGAQGIFIAQDGERQQTPCTGNVFSNLTVTNSRGAGLRVNDLSCIANTVADSRFHGNGEGAVSEAGERLLSQVNVDME